jgi:hypothetical protein
VDQARADFLACPTFPLNQDRHAGFGDHLQLAPDEEHLLTSTEKNFHRREISLGFVLREPYSRHIFLSPIARVVTRNQGNRSAGQRTRATPGVLQD